MDNLVSFINQKFETLRSLSNDDLRSLVWEIRNTICASEDKKSTIDDYLIEVFAIVRETARRFTEGKIIVTANHNDRKLAEKYDFISIEGEKAIYNNHWDAFGVQFVWNMVHYDEQILGGINLHYGRAIEMATGEGKTLVTTLPAFLNALSGDGVHIMTVNDYLSKRDYQLTRPIYLFYGLTVECVEEFSRSEYGRKVAYDSDITFGSNSSFVFDYLFDHLAVDPKDCLQRKHNYAIIDEIDSILIDEADTPHIVSGGTPFYDGDIYNEYLPIVNELISIESNGFYDFDRLNHTARFSNKGKEWLCNKLEIENLYKYNKLYEVLYVESLPDEKRKQIFFALKIQNVLNQILHALTVYEKDVDYVIDGGEAKIIDQNTGRIKPNSRWEHGLHTAIEVKEGVNVKVDHDGMAVISLKNYFKLYDKVAGMSGSILPIKDELLNVYELDCVQIPTHLPLIREDSPLKIFKSVNDKDKAIISEVISNWKNGRPSLIGSISLKRADEIGRLLDESNLAYNRLDARTTKDEAITVAKAGIGNSITLSTSVAGRGTDIKPSEDALNNGGLAVIGTDLFGSVRTGLQLRGRAGRQGNPGSSKFFASLEDDILKFLSKSEMDELKELAARIDGPDISTDGIRNYFDLAQTKREEKLSEIRRETAFKDDVIAPYRFKFYEQRNKALFDIEYACQQIREILAKSDVVRMEDVESHIGSLYVTTKELVLRSRRNNPNRSIIYVPFSANQIPFAIRLDVELLITSSEYFRKEFKRQNLLQIYDRFWKEFVVYLMQNLDNSEINRLADRYFKMMKTIESEIYVRLSQAVPVFKINSNKVERNDLSNRENPKNKKKVVFVRMGGEELCPCGSGLPYGSCHGISNDKSRRRRR